MRMKRVTIFLGVAIGLVALAMTATASEADSGPVVVLLPANAVEVAPNVYSLGTSVHNGKLLHGLLFVDTVAEPQPAKGGVPGPPSGDNGGGGNNGGSVDPSTCYSFIDTASDPAHWGGTPESWSFDGSGSGIGVSAGDMATALDAWEAPDAANTDIFGTGSDTPGLSVAQDGLNEAFFARLVGRGAGSVIAATWVYYDEGQSIYEWDMVFNTKYQWSLNDGVQDPALGDTSAMDFLDIATHEAGHAAGMGHTSSDSACSAQTMYPTASYGETQKRSLEIGDTTGAGTLYN
jgi:hypothetical protein